LLAIGELPSVDLLFYRSQWKAGTCGWILEEKQFITWSQADEPVSRLLWLSGGAATGKSVLSSFAINALEERGVKYQYFFIRHSQPRKRTLSPPLRSIAYQVGQGFADFLRKVVALEVKKIDFETIDPKSIWERLFRSILFRMEQEEPLYWVIDGLDEADNPRGFIELLSEISILCPSIRVMVTSRNTPELVAAFEPLSPTTISMDDCLEDILFFIRREVLFAGSAELKENLIRQLQKLSQLV
jgi:hypothetical protein